jgi:hypothetical protein
MAIRMPPFRLAVNESDALLKLARFQSAAEMASPGMGPAGQAGLEASLAAIILTFNACEALLAGGRTADAAALIGPLTTAPPDRDHWIVHQTRAAIDLLRGDTDGTCARQQLIDAIPARLGNVDFARESAQRAAELAVRAGRPGDALDEVHGALRLVKAPDLAVLCGRLLTAGRRACPDLAEQARIPLQAHRGHPGTRLAARGLAPYGLTGWELAVLRLLAAGRTNLDSRRWDQTLASGAYGVVDQGRWSDFSESGLRHLIRIAVVGFGPSRQPTTVTWGSLAIRPVTCLLRR